MKKMAFCIVPLIIVLMGCASSGKATTETNGGSSGMDLDAAIREAAAEMEAKIPSQTMVALVSVASPSTAFSTQVLTRLESAIVRSGKLVVVDRANLDKVREEQGFQLSGEVDDESAKSIGRLLGAGAIVTGSLADLGDVYSLTLKAINIETATVAVSYLADITKSTRIETLLASGGGAGPGTRTAQTAGSAASSNATPASSASPEPTVPVASAEPSGPVAPKVGDRGPAGGIIFYDKGMFFNGWQYLEAAPADLDGAQWAVNDQRISGTGTAVGTGKRNTELIVEQLGNGTAAQLCDALEFGGYNDWFLPSQDELDLMYRNLKQRGLGNFLNSEYWSSSYDSSRALGYTSWGQNFSNGSKVYMWQDKAASVRAIRAF
jgi:hypothetical protein